MIIHRGLWKRCETAQSGLGSQCDSYYLPINQERLNRLSEAIELNLLGVPWIPDWWLETNFTEYQTIKVTSGSVSSASIYDYGCHLIIFGFACIFRKRTYNLMLYDCDGWQSASSLKWAVLGQSERSRVVKMDSSNDLKWTVLGRIVRSKRFKVDDPEITSSEGRPVWLKNVHF